MGRIAITGAAGNVGEQAVAALSDHDLTLFTHREHDDVESTVLDVTDREAFVEALGEQDALVHLAANPSPEAEWDDLRGPNVDGVYNAFEAARRNGVDRVVFASSNHAVNMHNVADPAETETTRLDARPLHGDDPPRPDSYYGVTKVFGEAMGSYYADRHGLTVLNLRIGWLLTPEALRANQDEGEAHAQFARAMYLSPRDCRNALAAAATADVEGVHALNVVSRNDDRFLSLTATALTIGYRPRDNSAEVLDDS